MTDFKYTLIVSQYYHSRHTFIVHHKSDFIQKAKDFAKELILYKRDHDNKRELYLGDFDYFKENQEIHRRYNINDSGDIYFIQSLYANYCMSAAIGYREDSLRESRGFQKKIITYAISEHHNYEAIKKIVEKHFEIA